jgi:hypothetical protein
MDLCLNKRIVLSQCARRAIAEAEQRSKRLVIGWVTKIYYLELPRASEGTLNRGICSAPVSRRVEIRQAAGRRNNYRIFITT